MKELPQGRDVRFVEHGLDGSTAEWGDQLEGCDITPCQRELDKWQWRRKEEAEFGNV